MALNALCSSPWHLRTLLNRWSWQQLLMSMFKYHFYLCLGEKGLHLPKPICKSFGASSIPHTSRHGYNSSFQWLWVEFDVRVVKDFVKRCWFWALFPEGQLTHKRNVPDKATLMHIPFKRSCIKCKLGHSMHDNGLRIWACKPTGASSSSGRDFCCAFEQGA